MWDGQPLKQIESLRAIILVFLKFCIPIFVEVLFTATEVQLCQGLDVFNSIYAVQYILTLLRH